MAETTENHHDLGDLLVALGTLQCEHLEHPCGPELMPMYIKMAQDFLASIRACLEQNASIETSQRERVTALLQAWDTSLIPGYIESSIEALMLEARLHAITHVPPQELDAFLQNAEVQIHAAHKERRRAAA